MSSKRVGALYYEVMMDTKAVSSSVARTAKEQALVRRHLDDSISKWDKLQMELDATGKMYQRATDPKDIAALEATQREIIKKMRLIRIRAWQQERAERKKKQEQEAREAKKAAAILEKELGDIRKRMRSVDNFTRKQKIMWSKVFATRDLKDVRKAIAFSVRGLEKDLRGLSRIAGNAAQAMGFGPAVQGGIRLLGLLNAKMVLAGLAAVAAFKAFQKFSGVLMESADIFSEWEYNSARLQATLQTTEKDVDSLTHSLEVLAAKTAFESDELTRVAIKLGNMGTEIQNIMPMMETLTNLSVGGETGTLDRMAKAYTDVMSNGRLMMQEANQFANAGVPLITQLGRDLGRSSMEVRDMIKDGEISSNQVKEALENISRLRGDQSAIYRESLAGIRDETTATMTQAKRALGEIIFPAVKMYEQFKLAAASVTKMTAQFTNWTTQGLGGLWDVMILGNSFAQSMRETYKYLQNINSILNAPNFDFLKGQKLDAEIEEVLNKNIAELEDELEAEEAAAEARANAQEELAKSMQEQLDMEAAKRQGEEEALKLKYKQLVASEQLTQAQADELYNQELAVLQEERRLELIEERKKAQEEANEEQIRLHDEFHKEQERKRKEQADARRAELEAYNEMIEAMIEGEEKLIDKLEDKLDRINDKEAKKRGLVADALGGGSQARGFEAQGVEEFNFIRDNMRLGMRENMEAKIAKKAEKQREGIKKEIRNGNRDIRRLTVKLEANNTEIEGL